MCDSTKMSRKETNRAVKTFQYVLTMIEEEQREFENQQQPKTDNFIPDQKGNIDIECKIDSEINLFETQIKDCPTEEVAKLLFELKRRNNVWSKKRNGIGIQSSDSTKKFVTLLHTILENRIKRDQTVMPGNQPMNHDEPKGPNKRRSSSEEKGAAKVKKIIVTKDGFTQYADNPAQQHVQAYTFKHILSMIEEVQRKLAHIQQHKPEIDNIKEQTQEIIVIEGKIDSEINRFETQIKDCPIEEVAMLFVELERQQNGWCKERKDMGIQRSGSTKKFVTLLYTILAERVAKVPFQCDMECSKEVLTVAYQAIFGEHACAKLEKEFKENPEKKAKEPYTRRCEKKRSGSDRILEVQALKGFRTMDCNKKDGKAKSMNVKTTTKSDNDPKISGKRQINSKTKANTNPNPTGKDAGDKTIKKWKSGINEASKQMLYDVFGNVIRMLEEYEELELSQLQIHHKMPKSQINIPDERHRTIDNIRHIVEYRLTLFEIQTKACPAEVLCGVFENLMHLTLDWSVVRDERLTTDIMKTDYYITQLYEIVSKGRILQKVIRENTEQKLQRKQAKDCDKYATGHIMNRSSSDLVLEEKPSQGGFSNQHAVDQAMQQLHLQRSMEASKQMLYGGFGNVITIIEEFEKRELEDHGIHTSVQKSDIYIPEQSHKTFADIKSNVECQLLLFENQSEACPPEAIADIREELRRRTICWSAVRAELGITEIHRTDRYIAKLYEILAKGSTSHCPPDMPVITEDVMRSAFQKLLFGERDRAEIDKAFKTNPSKKSNVPVTRSSEMIQGGANRIFRACENEDLLRYLEADVSKIENDGPQSIL